jgi:hypothetical protein
MKPHSENGPESEPDLSAQVVAGMLRAVERRYALLFATAEQEWKARFGAGEPSDACASISIHPSHTLRVLVPFAPPDSASEPGKDA